MQRALEITTGANARASPVQRQRLGRLSDRNTAVILYLLMGLAVRGRITSFDDYVLLLRATDGRSSLIYKHTILSVLPVNPFEPAIPQP